MVAGPTSGPIDPHRRPRLPCMSEAVAPMSDTTGPSLGMQVVGDELCLVFAWHPHLWVSALLPVLPFSF